MLECGITLLPNLHIMAHIIICLRAIQSSDENRFIGKNANMRKQCYSSTFSFPFLIARSRIVLHLNKAKIVPNIKNNEIFSVVQSECVWLQFSSYWNELRVKLQSESQKESKRKNQRLIEWGCNIKSNFHQPSRQTKICERVCVCVKNRRISVQMHIRMYWCSNVFPNVYSITGYIFAVVDFLWRPLQRACTCTTHE